MLSVKMLCFGMLNAVMLSVVGSCDTVGAKAIYPHWKYYTALRQSA
jgi:hypothetical protein